MKIPHNWGPIKDSLNYKTTMTMNYRRPSDQDEFLFKEAEYNSRNNRTSACCYTETHPAVTRVIIIAVGLCIVNILGILVTGEQNITLLTLIVTSSNITRKSFRCTELSVWGRVCLMKNCCPNLLYFVIWEVKDVPTTEYFQLQFVFEVVNFQSPPKTREI